MISCKKSASTCYCSIIHSTNSIGCATYQTARETIQIRHKSPSGHVIFRLGDQNWPFKSCKFNTVGLFLRGVLKSKAYANKRINLRLGKGNWALYQRNSSTFARNGHGKFQQEWGCASKAVESICPSHYSVHNFILYCVSKLLLELILGHLLVRDRPWPCNDY